MKKLVNPTTYFFEEAQKIPKEINVEIENFVKTLLNKDKCQLCKNDYDIMDRVPRILIHCGHTFCTSCLEQFYMKRKVRCPMCLKLVKELDSLERLPINHTIFTYLVDKNIRQCEQQQKRPLIRNAGKYLFSQFQRVQKQAHRLENPPKYDPESGLPFCVFHPDRVEHFYCQDHKSFGCRPCIQIGHTKPECKVVDLNTVQNPGRYQQMMEQHDDISQRFIPSARFHNQQGIFRYGSVMDPALMDDDDQDDDDDSDEFHQTE